MPLWYFIFTSFSLFYIHYFLPFTQQNLCHTAAPIRPITNRDTTSYNVIFSALVTTRRNVFRYFSVILHNIVYMTHVQNEIDNDTHIYRHRPEIIFCQRRVCRERTQPSVYQPRSGRQESNLQDDMSGSVTIAEGIRHRRTSTSFWSGTTHAWRES